MLVKQDVAYVEEVDSYREMSTIVLLAVARKMDLEALPPMATGKFSILKKTRAKRSLPSRRGQLADNADPHLLFLCLSLHLSWQSLRR